MYFTGKQKQSCRSLSVGLILSGGVERFFYRSNVIPVFNQQLSIN
ncbi:protein of unknown function [Serratia sp. Tan611]|nr:protein of unknown function [Serratia sp. Tan611]